MELPIVECVGCGACQQICPRKCISLDRDSKGFLRPTVNAESCVSCGLCREVCPSLNVPNSRPVVGSFAAFHKDKLILRNSSSGGIFHSLAAMVLDNGGVVFGAAFDQEWNVRHAYVESKEDLHRLMGSKYVQSQIDDSYRKAKGFLVSGREVLFTGTPCQIAGLKAYLRREYDNLTTLDFICHGVPSPNVWQRYLSEKSKEASCVLGSEARIRSVSFRDKSDSWKRYSLSLSFVNPETRTGDKVFRISASHRKDPYMRAFLNDFILRPSCNSCRFKNHNSNSDITVGDFWRCRNTYPKFYNPMGVSLAVCYTSKGLNCMNSTDLSFMPLPIEKIVKSNQSIIRSSEESPQSALFWKRYGEGQSLKTIMDEVSPYRQLLTEWFKEWLGNVIYKLRTI